MRYLKKRTSLNFTLYCNAMLLINFLPRDINLPNAQCMLNQLQTPMFAFQMKLFSDLTSKTFLYKIARYHQLFQCITHQHVIRICSFYKFIWKHPQASTHAFALAFI